MTTVRFISSNEFKIKEAGAILGKKNIRLVPVKLKINELQTNDMELLVRDKVLQAFKELGRPLFVEHTGLYLNYLNGLPGGLTQLFWDTLQAERVCELFGKSKDPAARAETIIGYCDGRNIRIFKGEIGGRINDTPKGDRSFQWDCVFVPEGSAHTFAELGEKKNEISMRRKALDRLAAFLEGK